MTGPCDHCGQSTRLYFITTGDMGRGSFYRCSDCCDAVTEMHELDSALDDIWKEGRRD